MTSSIASIQTQILELIHIPSFSDDVRLIILDYVHFRNVTKFKEGGVYYYFRLGVSLEDDKLCLQISIYKNNFYRMISSFGIQCEEKAIQEYNTLLCSIPNFQSIYDNKVFICAADDDYVYYRRYAFCPSDESTIMIRLHAHRRELSVVNVTLYFMETIETQHYGCSIHTNIVWTAYGRHNRYYFENMEHLQPHMLVYQQLAIKHGKKLVNYNYRVSSVIEKKFLDSVWSFSPTYSKES